MLTITALALALHAAPPWTDHIEWTDDGPEAREHATVLTFDDAVVVYAGSGYQPQLSPLGDAWSFDLDLQTWSKLPTEGDLPTPGGSKRVAQVHDGPAYIFGGYGQQFACHNDLHRIERKNDALVFTAIEQHNPPPPRALHAFAWDPQTNRLFVAFGVTTRGFLGDAWTGEFDDEGVVTWTPLETPNAPEPRFGFSFACDTDSGSFVLCSGQLAPTPESQLRMADDLWSINLRSETPAWTQHPLDAPLTGRRNPCFAFDDDTDCLLIWCGTADTRTNVPGLITVKRSAETWELHESDDADSPPRRSSGFGFAHPHSTDIVVGFGNSAEGTYRDWITISPPPNTP